MLGIIGAMDVEIESIKKNFEYSADSIVSGIKFTIGSINDSDVCVAKCSPGKVNAAMCVQAMIDTFDIDRIINVGVACSLREDIDVKNVVIASDVCQYDIDITALGEPRGFINGLNVVKIKTDSELTDKLAAAAINRGAKIHRGTAASGDTFIADTDLKKMLSVEFDAVCGDMESGAVGHVCACAGIPFAVMRSISDSGNENSRIDYPLYKKIAAEISTAIILEYINLVSD